MLLRKRVALPDIQHSLLALGIGVLFVLAIVLRVSLYHVETSDYNVFVSQWYDFIQTHGGFAALKYNFSNYNVPYLYLLTLLTFLPIPQLIAIKSLSVVFDGVLALFVYLLIRLKYPRGYAAIAGALVLAFAPTIFINSAAWGQCDSIYTAFCLGSLYFLLKERPGWACVFFALALSFKLQAIFFLPVLLVLLLTRKMPVRYLVLIPLVFLLMLVPAFIAGRGAGSLLSIYVGQATTGGVGGGGVGRVGGGYNGSQFTGRGRGQFNGGTQGQGNGNGSAQSNNGQQGQPPSGRQYGNGNSGQFTGRGNGGFGRGGGNNSSSLTYNAPSFYQWLSASAPAYWEWIGIALAGVFVAGIGALVFASKKPITHELLIKIALVFAIGIPFLLPEMHDRYFYLADVLSIVAAFYFPRMFYVAIGMQICSLLSYVPYLLNTEIIGLPYVAFLVLLLAIVTSVDLLFTLYPSLRERIVNAGFSNAS